MPNIRRTATAKSSRCPHGKSTRNPEKFERALMHQQETSRNLYNFRHIYPLQTGWENDPRIKSKKWNDGLAM